MKTLLTTLFVILTIGVFAQTPKDRVTSGPTSITGTITDIKDTTVFLQSGTSTYTFKIDYYLSIEIHKSNPRKAQLDSLFNYYKAPAKPKKTSEAVALGINKTPGQYLVKAGTQQTGAVIFAILGSGLMASSAFVENKGARTAVLGIGSACSLTGLGLYISSSIQIKNAGIALDIK